MRVLQVMPKRKGAGNILLQYRNKVTSSNGEDGIIEYVAARMNVAPGYCVEFGAWDGRVGSNTWNLLNHRGWKGLLIEADPAKYTQLENLYRNHPGVVTANAFVGWEGDAALDRHLERHGVPADFALLSIDIDGNDLHVWRSLTCFRPRIVIVEFNNHIPNDILFIQEPDVAVNQGSSLLALIELGKQKGYELVCALGCNAFFVPREHYPLFGIENNHIDAMFDDTRTETRVFQCYDGTLVLAGKKSLNWHKIDFCDEDIQILPASLRRYGKRLDVSSTA